VTGGVSWRTVAEPIGRRLLKGLPNFIFVRYYNARDLEDDIEIRLRSARLTRAKLLKGLEAPSLFIELEVFNLSPYLDVRVTAVRSLFSACDEEGLEHTFAHLDDWAAFELPRGRPCPLHLWHCPNEYQTAILSTYSEAHFSLNLFVTLRVESPIGMAHPIKLFRTVDLAGRWPQGL